MDAAERKYIKMTTAPVKGLVCSFALPSIICMLTTSIYNMADTYFVSRLNTQSIAAVGIVFSYMGIIQAISFFFGHGSGNYISRELGARRPEKAGTIAAGGLPSLARQGLTFVSLICLNNFVAGKAGLLTAQPISDICAFLLCIPLFVKAYRELK